MPPPPEIFPLLDGARTGREIQLSDALDEMARRGRLCGVLLPGLRFDTGTPAGLLEASLHRALSGGDSEKVKRLPSKLR